MKIEDKNIDLIHRVISGYLPGCQILLFGSRSNLTFTSNSDYDLLVIIPSNMDVKTKMNLKTLLRKELLKYDIRSDILIQSSEEIEAKRTFPGHIIKTAIAEGIRI